MTDLEKKIQEVEAELGDLREHLRSLGSIAEELEAEAYKANNDAAAAKVGSIYWAVEYGLRQLGKT